MDKKLRITLFGGLFIEVDGQPVTKFKTQKEAVLLAYLAVAQRPFTREYLANLFWDDRSQKQALSNLRTVLSRFRKVAGEYIQITRQTVTIIPEKIWVDFVEFNHLLNQVENEQLTASDIAILETAVSYYQGDFLAGVAIGDSQGLENWQLFTSEQARNQAINSHREIAFHYLSIRQPSKGIPYAQAYTQLDPLREDGHRLLMRLLTRNGQINNALQQYQQCVAILAKELGVSPSPETDSLYHRLQTVRSTPPHRIPPQPTQFWGRSTELAAIDALLQSRHCRLVTILGAGGAGKTRLAIATAHQIRGDYLHGIFFVSLESIETAVQIPTLIGQAMGVQFSGQNSPKSQLIHYLQNKELLLILDNIEQLLQDSDTILLLQLLLTESPDLKIIVTSRVRLRLRLERIVPLTGLPFPDKAANIPIEWQAYESLQFFDQCAQWQGITKDIYPLEDAIKLCQLVEGLPLAIELAVSTLEEKPLSKTVDTLQKNLDLLTTTMHDVPQRHRSMRAVFDYSWELLQVNEQTILAQLSIFHGGAQKTAILAITQATPTILKNLTDKSLIRQESEDRYSMHPLIIQFAREKLSENPQLTFSLAQTHAEYYLQQIREKGMLIYTSQYTAVLHQIRHDIANTLQAWAWATQEKSLELLRLASRGFVEYFIQSDLYQDGFDLFTQTIEQLSDTANEHPVLSSLKISQVRFLRYSGNYQQGLIIIEEALKLAQKNHAIEEELRAQTRYGDLLLSLSLHDEALTQYKKISEHTEISQFPLLEAASYRLRGFILNRLGKITKAEIYCLQALQLYKKVDGQHGYVLTLRNLSKVYISKDQIDSAQKCLEEAVELAQARSPFHRAMIQSDLGIIYHRLYKYAAAINIFTDKLALAQEYGLCTSEGLELLNLGNVYRGVGHYDTAHEYYLRALNIFQNVGEQNLASQVFIELGIAYFNQKQYKKAIQTLQEALNLTEAIGTQINHGQALTYCGHSYTALKQWTKAQAQYENALDLYIALGLKHAMLSVRLGLAKIAWAQDKKERAFTEMMVVLPYLENSETNNTKLSLELYWWAYQLLTTMAHKKAQPIFDLGQAKLLNQVSQIDDLTLQQDYLHQVPLHQDFLDSVAPI